MNLEEFFKATGMKKMVFAQRCGFTPATLKRIMDGRDMSLSTAYRIEEETKGIVTCQDLAKKISKGKSKPDQST